MNEQSTLRDTIIKKRLSLSAQYVEAHSSAISTKILELPSLQKAQSIACYISHRNEVDLTELIKTLHDGQQDVYLPIIHDDKSLSFGLYKKDHDLTLNRYGIPEPPHSDIKQGSELDIVITPLAVFDQAFNRIGMGGGYYDRTFGYKRKNNEQPPLLVGVAYGFQEVVNIQSNPTDVKLDIIITEHNHFQSR